MLHVQSHFFCNQQGSIYKWLYQENISFDLAIEGKLALHHPSPAKSKLASDAIFLNPPFISPQSQEHAKNWTSNYKLQKFTSKNPGMFFPFKNARKNHRLFLGPVRPSTFPLCGPMAFYAAAEPPKGVPLPTVPSTHRLRPVWFGGG